MPFFRRHASHGRKLSLVRLTGSCIAASGGRARTSDGTPEGNSGRNVRDISALNGSGGRVAEPRAAIHRAEHDLGLTRNSSSSPIQQLNISCVLHVKSHVRVVGCHYDLRWLAAWQHFPSKCSCRKLGASQNIVFNTGLVKYSGSPCERSTKYIQGYARSLVTHAERVLRLLGEALVVVARGCVSELLGASLLVLRLEGESALTPHLSRRQKSAQTCGCSVLATPSALPLTVSENCSPVVF